MGLNIRKLMLMAIDAATIVIASILAFVMLTEMDVLSTTISDFYMSILLFVVLSIACMFICRVYTNIWRFAQISDFIKCFMGLTISFAFLHVLCDILKLRCSHLMLIF